MVKGVMIGKAFLPCIALAAAAFYPGAAAALCSMPVSPYCVEDRPVIEGEGTIGASCLRRVENHLERLRSYRNCLQAQIEKTDGEIDGFEAILSEDGPDRGGAAS